MRARPAEIGQHAVAHQLRDVALVAKDFSRDDALINRERLPHLLRVKSLRKLRRADQIHEHHGELPTLRLAMGRKSR